MIRLSGVFRHWILPVVLACGLASSARSADSPHLRMGQPSPATDDDSNKNDFLMKKEFFALSYNNKNGTPNWVSWYLTKNEIGDAPRPRVFKPDDNLPDGFKKIVHKDYTGGGFDRGHMCPHGDRAKDPEMSKVTFIMTNVIPQSAENNQKAWNSLEIYTRDLVENHGKVCYIVAGPEGKGGVGKTGLRTTIANGKVTVPAKTWKVILVLDKEVNDPTEIHEGTNMRLIAVVMPNDRTPDLEWDRYRTSVEQVEELTGLKFFSKVPAAIIGPLKEEVDDEPIPPPAPPHHGRNNN